MSYPRKRGDQSVIESHYIVRAVNCLTFSYNMSGENLGRLNVFSVDQNEKTFLLWRLAGDQGNQWKTGQAQVHSPFGFKVNDGG